MNHNFLLLNSLFFLKAIFHIQFKFTNHLHFKHNHDITHQLIVFQLGHFELLPDASLDYKNSEIIN